MEFVYENPIGLNLKLILSTNHCAPKMLCYISYQYKLLHSKFPIGKRQNNFQCKEPTFILKKIKYFRWQTCTNWNHLNMKREKKKGNTGLEQNGNLWE